MDVLQWKNEALRQNALDFGEDKHTEGREHNIGKQTLMK